MVFWAAWFEANRPCDEAAYRDPARTFVQTIGPALQAIAPGLATEPRVNGSIFRINRDTRLTKDNERVRILRRSEATGTDESLHSARRRRGTGAHGLLTFSVAALDVAADGRGTCRTGTMCLRYAAPVAPLWPLGVVTMRAEVHAGEERDRPGGGRIGPTRRMSRMM